MFTCAGKTDDCEKLWFEQYAEDKGLNSNDIIYLIEVVNWGDIPAFLLAWSFIDLHDKGKTEMPWDGNVGVRDKKFKDKLNDESKTRAYNSLDESGDLVKIEPEKQYIFYPDEFKDIDEEVEKLKKHNKIKLR